MQRYEDKKIDVLKKPIPVFGIKEIVLYVDLFHWINQNSTIQTMTQEVYGKPTPLMLPTFDQT